MKHSNTKMIKVVYNDKDVLKKAYLKTFKKGILRDGLDVCVSTYPELANILPEGCKADDLLVMDYAKLVDIYFGYQGLRKTMNKDDFADMDAFLKSTFNYKTRQSNIAKFFMNSANAFQIHTCHYCDTSYINFFKRVVDGQEMNHFDLDHVLDWGECPLVGLSLFNFTPSCQVCNEKLKHSDLIGDTPEEVKKLSPTSDAYDFENNVRVCVDPENMVVDNYIANANLFTIDFKPLPGKDLDYLKIVKLFCLKERYTYHKSEALRLLDLKHNYDDSNIRKIADLLGKRPEDVREDIFGEAFSKNQHRCFGQLKRDILKGISS